MRYIDVITKFREFCSSHLQVNTYYNGESFDFQSVNNMYPAVVTVDLPSEIQKGQTILSFSVWFIDKLKLDLSNKDEVYSETLMILQDFISYFDDDFDENDFYLDDETITFEPFLDDLDDKVAGWVANIRVIIPFDRNKCIIPSV